MTVVRWTLRKLVAEKIPAKPGAKLALYHLTQPLILHQNLEQQGIAGESATLSCTYIPTNLEAAWVYVQGIRVFEEGFALEGVTHIAGAVAAVCLHHLPQSLKGLTFADHFYQSLGALPLPRQLQSLSFGRMFNQRLERVSWPSSLQSLTFGAEFNQSLDRVTLPSGLQSLTFGKNFHQLLDKVTWPSSLKSLTFGEHFNQSLE